MGPIFIMGYPRSGTTAMATALGGLGRLGPYSTEGHFLYLFSNGIKRLAAGKLNEVSMLRPEPQREKFLAAFAGLVNTVFSPTDDPHDTTWIDKTPGLAQLNAIPGLLPLWPDARFIFLYRPPHDAVRSNIANWPDRMTGREVDAAERWLECQRAWRRHRPLLPRHHVAEIFQPDMLARPAEVAATLQSLLSLSDEEAAALTAYWSENRKLNRPTTGERGDAYDKVALTDSAAATISAVTDRELPHWPRLTVKSAA